MAHFRYRSLDDLRADVADRGHAIGVAGAFARIADRVRIGDRMASNRMAVHPMEGCDGNLDGTPGELTFRRWRRFAEGGAALLWGEATAVVPEARANPRQLLISPATAPGLKRLLDETRAARRERFGSVDGFIIGLQLTHSGRWSHGAPIIAHRAHAIDAVRTSEQLIGDDELERLEDRFVDAAVIARDIGFDFVDIKQCHTYLLNELLAARSRAGAYGGGFDNRTRFVRNVFAKIRARIGPTLLLATRINAYDGVPFRAGVGGAGAPAAVDCPYRDGWGVDADDPARADLSEPLRLIADLRELGLALVNVTAGSPYLNPHIGRPFDKPPVDGYLSPEHPLAGVERHLWLTAAVQRAHPGLPVVGTGYSWLRHFALNVAEASIAAGDTTMVGLGRGALAYPDFAVDALEHGRMERDRACIGVSYCTALMRAKHNEMGQYATGCVPRDKMYATSFKEAERTEGWSRRSA
jgi:2,4-dienoyl-CoA reductase-like NADH-dependent reductase (Old Yellow Enzyme family)